MVTELGDVLRGRLYFVPLQSKSFPSAPCPSAMRRKAPKHIPYSRPLVREGIGTQHERIHERPHRPYSGRVHKPALSRRTSPGIGKRLLHHAPVEQERVVHRGGVAARAVVLELSECTGWRLEASPHR